MNEIEEKVKAILDETVERLSGTGFPHTQTVKFSVADAETIFKNGLRYFLKDSAVWQEEYRPVVDWLSDNKGKGLLLSGNCGTGKTLICSRIIPVLLYSGCNRLMCIQCHSVELGRRLKEMMLQKIVVIDDVGSESLYQEYGNKHYAFNELVDNAERKGNMLIVTTNLCINDLTAKYGERTIDRLRGLTKLVTFTGKSLRK